MVTPDRDVVEAVVAGDAAGIPVLEGWTHAELAAASAEVDLVVEASAVASMISRLVTGEVSASLAQRWASFVRRGYVSASGGGPVANVDIAYDPLFEEAIVEAVARLDELGDLVDGSIDAHEAQRLIAQLSPSTRPS